MSARFDVKLREHCTGMQLNHLAESPSSTSAQVVVARREVVGCASVRRRVRRARIDGGARQQAMSEELEESAI
jgi:hypothetical protein